MNARFTPFALVSPCLKVGWLAVLAWFGWVGASQAAEPARRPNFLVIIADDLCGRDLGYEGDPNVRTPNLDKLRTESMHLRGMFNPATTCSPTRHALFTGLYPVRSGAFPNHTRVYDGTRSVFGELKDIGYRVALQNKEHVAPAASFPYEHIRGADDFAEAGRFIARDPAQPWLLVFASNDPHNPWTRGPRYDPAKLTLPPYLHDDPGTRAQRARYYGEVTQLDTQVGALLATLEKSGQAGDTLVLFVSEQGSSFPYGGKWEVYDNGIHASSLVRWPGRVAPGSTSRALMQYVDVAPTFLEAAGVDPARVDVGCPDAHGNKGFDGRSLLPVWLGRTDTFRDCVFAEETTLGVFGAREPYPIRGARDTRYKYIRNLAPENTLYLDGMEDHQPYKRWKNMTDRFPARDPQFTARVAFLTRRPAEELYDLQADPYEVNNLADDPRHADAKENLKKRLAAWMDQQGDKGLETEKRALSRQERGREREEEDEGPGNQGNSKKAGQE